MLFINLKDADRPKLNNYVNEHQHERNTFLKLTKSATFYTFISLLRLPEKENPFRD